MPRSCSVCHHAQRAAIDQALHAGEAFRNISGRFGTSTTALHRHKHAHLLTRLADVQQLQDAPAAAQDSPPQQQAPVATPPATAPPLSLEAQEALAEYRNIRATLAAYEAMSAREWKRSPVSPPVVLNPFVQQLEAAKQRLRALGIIHPEHVLQHLREE